MNWRTMKELLLKQGFEEKRTSKARVLTGLKLHVTETMSQLDHI